MIFHKEEGAAYSSSIRMLAAPDNTAPASGQWLPRKQAMQERVGSERQLEPAGAGPYVVVYARPCHAGTRPEHE